MRIAIAFSLVLFAAAVVSVWYVSLGAGTQGGRERQGGEAQAGLDQELAALRELRREHAALAERVRILEERAPAAPGGSAGASSTTGVVAPAAGLPEPGAEPESPEAESAAEREEKVASAIAALTRSGSTEEDWQRTWADLTREGLVDDAVAAFEERVKADPRNADRRVELGGAYLQKLVTVNDLEKGEWAIKADKSFDEALAVDEQHWQARFSKAAALSYWPAVTGKPAEAMKHFETLCAQQEQGPPQKKYANTYLMLGNMYQSQGNAAKAGETWQRGAELHPDNAELRAKRDAAGR